MQKDKEQQSIRVRTGLAVVKEGKLLLVPHYLENGEIKWYLPGGKVEYLEGLKDAAAREFEEETGLAAKVEELLDIFELIEPEKSWHSIALTYTGTIVGGTIKAEKNSKYGDKTPKWFTADDLVKINYHPIQAINKVMGIGK